MLQFLQPIWLWGSVAILLPLLIHLLNVRSGKTLKVGSIALFSEAAKTGSRKVKLTEWWLLLLRCLLLICLSFLLAKPVWLKDSEAKEKGWLLIPPVEIAKAYQQQKPLIDSLLKAGFRFHYFDGVFREEEMNKALQNSVSQVRDSSLNYWSLLKELNDVLPAQTLVFLFSDNKLKHFAGLRPEVSFPLQWRVLSEDDTGSRWLQSAWQTGADSTRLTTAKSIAEGTQYSWKDVTMNLVNDEFIIDKDKHKASIKSANQTEVVSIDTSLLRIVMYAPQSSEDAAYVKAAIEAIQHTTKLRIDIQEVNTVKTIPPNYDWLFWLSDDPLPDSLRKNHLWLYETEKSKNIYSSLVLSQIHSFEASVPISVDQYIVKDSGKLSGEEVVWQTASGKPVLTREKGHTEIFHFYSRFNPQWNDLVWNASFPQVMYDIIFDSRLRKDLMNLNDERVLDQSQIMPVISISKSIKNQNKRDTEDMAKPMWLLFFALFLFERILSFQYKSKEV